MRWNNNDNHCQPELTSGLSGGRLRMRIASRINWENRGFGSPVCSNTVNSLILATHFNNVGFANFPWVKHQERKKIKNFQNIENTLKKMPIQNIFLHIYAFMNPLSGNRTEDNDLCGQCGTFGFRTNRAALRIFPLGILFRNPPGKSNIT